MGDSRLECFAGRSTFFVFVLMHCASSGAFVFLYLCSSVFVFFCLCICICAFVYPRLKCCEQVELFKSPSVCWRYLQTCTHTKGYTFTFLDLAKDFQFQNILSAFRLRTQNSIPTTLESSEALSSSIPACRVSSEYFKKPGQQKNVRDSLQISFAPSNSKLTLFSERLVLEKQSALASPGGSESQQFVQVFNHQSVLDSIYLYL